VTLMADTGVLERLKFTLSELIGFAFEGGRLEHLEHVARPRADELRLDGLAAYVERLRALAPPGLEYLCATNNISVMLHAERARHLPMPYDEVMEIEPNGAVRAIVTYEGIVGNILHDPPAELWRRCQERVHHPRVVEELAAVKTPIEWAAAVRRLDAYFGTPQDLIRFGRRGRPEQAAPAAGGAVT
jgi:hypothetical protein